MSTLEDKQHAIHSLQSQEREDEEKHWGENVVQGLHSYCQGFSTFHKVQEAEEESH